MITDTNDVPFAAGGVVSSTGSVSVLESCGAQGKASSRRRSTSITPALRDHDAAVLLGPQDGRVLEHVLRLRRSRAPQVQAVLAGEEWQSRHETGDLACAGDIRGAGSGEERRQFGDAMPLVIADADGDVERGRHGRVEPRRGEA